MANICPLAKLLGLDTAKIYREIWCQELKKMDAWFPNLDT